MRVWFRPWWPVLGWTAAIGVFTMLPVADGALGPSASYLDNVVHFGLYLGLGWSAGRALWLSRRATPGAVLLALAGGLGLAATNEWLQRFVPPRVPSAADWLADVAGVSLGIALYLWPRAHRAARREGPGVGSGAGRERAG